MSNRTIYAVSCLNCDRFMADDGTMGGVSDAWFVEAKDVPYIQDSIKDAKHCCDNQDLDITKFLEVPCGEIPTV